MFCLQSNNASLDVGRTQRTYGVRTEKKNGSRMKTGANLVLQVGWELAQRNKGTRNSASSGHEFRTSPPRHRSYTLKFHPLRAYKHRVLICGQMAGS